MGAQSCLLNYQLIQYSLLKSAPAHCTYSFFYNEIHKLWRKWENYIVYSVSFQKTIFGKIKLFRPGGTYVHISTWCIPDQIIPHTLLLYNQYLLKKMFLIFGCFDLPMCPKVWKDKKVKSYVAIWYLLQRLL